MYVNKVKIFKKSAIKHNDAKVAWFLDNFYVFVRAGFILFQPLEYQKKKIDFGRFFSLFEETDMTLVSDIFWFDENFFHCLKKLTVLFNIFWFDENFFHCLKKRNWYTNLFKFHQKIQKIPENSSSVCLGRHFTRKSPKIFAPVHIPWVDFQ